MKSAILAIILTVSPGAVLAQGSGVPTQSGAQEPEVPGNPPPTPGQPPSDPDSVPVPQNTPPRKQDRITKPENDECAPGKDAQTCVERQRGRK